MLCLATLTLLCIPFTRLAEKMTFDADKALKVKNLALNKSLRAKAHTLWLQERQALDEVSKDRNLEKQEEAAVARAGSEAATLAARMDKRILAVNQEVPSSACVILLGCHAVCSSMMQSKRRSSLNKR